MAHINSPVCGPSLILPYQTGAKGMKDSHMLIYEMKSIALLTFHSHSPMEKLYCEPTHMCGHVLKNYPKLVVVVFFPPHHLQT